MEERVLGVGVIGAGWMGHVHARAYARLPHHYPELRIRTRLVAVADSVPAQAEDFAARYAPDRVYADWAALLADPEVEAVSITVPNTLHRDVAVAAARAGRHLWIEKPVGLTADDARAVAEAVAGAGVQATVGFNYRNLPAVARARRLIADGAIGTPTHARVHFLTDYAAHPAGALSWRFLRAQGGSGVLGDLGSHGVDLVRFLLGDLERVVADTAVFVLRRPLTAPGGSHYAVVDTPDGPTGAVENEDYVCALLRTRGGVRVTFEAGRTEVGSQNAYGFAVQGSEGLVAWDFRRAGELTVSAGGDYLNQPAQTVFPGPGDGEYARFQPGPGIVMGYDDTKVIEAAAFLRGVEEGVPHGPTPEDAVRGAEALEAMARSAATGAWIDL
ncbi:Gfo/Idh/MocA family protein [Actinoallomurus rhizosphaericola]|uniref:Gfo/Idh/MocA family protein n=1 Tax=Actinoallomurus rhizosphaericola TaxID=2952536 RepID=UPI00209204E8|nr:Gfo/Idh/MocA family oxidoreductase [Actinoallomurus rhizosphaericola]MCO5997327.1 Gfo/Idh/MocA family oxidoreductase [Actinoallomurus rhizosphaericola]